MEFFQSLLSKLISAGKIMHQPAVWLSNWKSNLFEKKICLTFTFPLIVPCQASGTTL